MSNEAGWVEIVWKVEEPKGGPHLSLEWRETGGPTVVAPKRRGFGSRLIERSLAGELGAEVRLTYEPAGASCTIDVPLGGGAGRPTTRPLARCSA